MTRSRLPVAAAGTVALLAACAAPVNEAGGPVVPPQFEIEAQRSEQTLTVDARTGVLTAAGRGTLAGFLTRAEDGNEAALHVRIDADPATAAKLTRAVIANGIEPGKVETGRSDGPAVPPGQARIVAVRYRAVLPDCPVLGHLTIVDGANDHNSNFGCAMRNALAAQVADPRDLVRGEDGGMTSGVLTSAAIDRLNTDKVKEIEKNATSEAGGGQK